MQSWILSYAVKTNLSQLDVVVQCNNLPKKNEINFLSVRSRRQTEKNKNIFSLLPTDDIIIDCNLEKKEYEKNSFVCVVQRLVDCSCVVALYSKLNFKFTHLREWEVQKRVAEKKNQWNNWIGNGDVAKYNVNFSIYLMPFCERHTATNE